MNVLLLDFFLFLHEQACVLVICSRRPITDGSNNPGIGMSSLAEGIAIGAGSTLAATFAWYFVKKRLDKRDIPNFDLDRFVETGKDYVGIHNTDTRSIDACLISCDGKVCKWWDDKSEDPRIIASGGGGNVLLLFSGSEDPLVIVKSRKRTLRKIRYSRISKRK